MVNEKFNLKKPKAKPWYDRDCEKQKEKIKEDLILNKESGFSETANRKYGLMKNEYFKFIESKKQEFNNVLIEQLIHTNDSKKF